MATKNICKHGVELAQEIGCVCCRLLSQKTMAI